MESINTEKANYTNSRVSYSQIRMYRECRYKWYHYYELGLRTRGVIDLPRLHIGSLIHKGLEMAFLLKWVNQTVKEGPEPNLKPISDESLERTISEGVEQYHQEYIEKLGEGVTDEHKLELEELADKATRIAIRAIYWLDLSKYRVVTAGGEPLVENKLTMPQEHWEAFTGRLDVVLEEVSSGNVYLTDAKCRETFQTYDNEETNEQFPIYQKFLKRLDVDISGVLTWQIKTREPKLPEMTQKGTLSRKKITTDWETYLQAIDACGFSPDDYEGVREWASKVEFQRFNRNYRSEVEVENIWRGIDATTEEMRRVDLPIYRNLRPGFSGCHDCMMRELCLTELRGGDANWIKKMRYRHVTEPNVMLPLAAEVRLHE